MDKQTMIQRLKRNRENTVQYSAFSEDNHAGIDAMIKTLEQELSEDKVYKTFPTKHEQDCALNILDVLNGEVEFDQVLFPENAV